MTKRKFNFIANDEVVNLKFKFPRRIRWTGNNLLFVKAYIEHHRGFIINIDSHVEKKFSPIINFKLTPNDKHMSKLCLNDYLEIKGSKHKRCLRYIKIPAFKYSLLANSRWEA